MYVLLWDNQTCLIHATEILIWEKLGGSRQCIGLDWEIHILEE